MLSYCRPHFSISLSPSLPLSSNLLNLTLESTDSTIYFLTLSSCSLREMEVCKLFSLDVCAACYLSILINSFPPFSPKSSELQHLSETKNVRAQRFLSSLCPFLCLLVLTSIENAYRRNYLPFNVLVSMLAVQTGVRLSFGNLRLDSFAFPNGINVALHNCSLWY